MPLIVSKKEELIGSISEERGNWTEIITLEIDIPDDTPGWTLQITGTAVVSGMQLRLRKDGQVLDWIFGTGNRSDWEQQTAIDIIQGVSPGKHQITLEGTMGTAMRRRLIAMAWREEISAVATSSSTGARRKSTAKKKAARKAPRKKAISKASAPRKKQAAKKKSKTTK